jgi:WD40 repeat protein
MCLYLCVTLPHPPPHSLQQRIPGSDGSEISSVAWARAPGDAHWRLFASTLDGSLHELSCEQLQPIATTDSFGGAIWCMRPAPSSGSSSTAAAGFVTQLAAACGDGSVKLYAVQAHAAGAEYVRSLPRVEGNVLALAWHPDGRSLVSGGSDGCIHSWDVQRGER